MVVGVSGCVGFGDVGLIFQDVSSGAPPGTPGVSTHLLTTLGSTSATAGRWGWADLVVTEEFVADTV